MLSTFCMLFTATSFLGTYTQESPMFLYKIITVENWSANQDRQEIILSNDDRTFIHFSTKEQLPRILEKYWHDKAYIVLKVNTEQLRGTLVLEPNRPGGDKYYHLYNGYIPTSAVTVDRAHEA